MRILVRYYAMLVHLQKLVHTINIKLSFIHSIHDLFVFDIYPKHSCHKKKILYTKLCDLKDIKPIITKYNYKGRTKWNVLKQL